MIALRLFDMKQRYVTSVLVSHKLTSLPSLVERHGVFYFKRDWWREYYYAVPNPLVCAENGDTSWSRDFDWAPIDANTAHVLMNFHAHVAEIPRLYHLTRYDIDRAEGGTGSAIRLLDGRYVATLLHEINYSFWLGKPKEMKNAENATLGQ